MAEGFAATAFAYFWRPELPYVIVIAAALAAAGWVFLAAERRAVKNTLGFFALCLAGQFGAALIEALGFAGGAAFTHEMFLVGSGLALIRLAGLLIFRALLPGLGLRPPRILEDILVILAYVAWGMVRLRYAGLDLSGIVATSAVITAVVAFAMQDTLGNIMGGLALQLDSSVELGDWIRVDDLSGQVVEIHWRYTAVETRSGETVIIPNSLLMKTKFVVVSGPGQPSPRSRRQIPFDVEFGAAPSTVIDKVERAFAKAEIQNVLADPAPSCVLMDFGPGYGHYVLRYWLLDPRPEDLTDSNVRLHLYAALQRAGMRLAVPESAMHVTKETEQRQAVRRAKEIERRRVALQNVRLFASFTEEERAALAERLVYAPFVRGDVITRQGAVSHWLYLLVEGEADIWLEAPDQPRRLLTTLHNGDIFGEMGLLTGEPRRATVTARTDVQCYRLDKAGFEDIIQSRPAIAEEVSHVLAEREAEILQVRQAMDQEATGRAVAASRTTIVGKIRSFFGLN